MIRTTPRLLSALFACYAAAAALHAQDGRGTVSEPTIPAVCTVVSATQSITSAGEPSGEVTTTGSLVTQPDTAAIQAALNSSACAGKAVELSVSGSNTAFLTGPIYVPTGVTLLLDGGVTVFASRNAADYQIGTVTAGTQEQCGTVGTLGNGCYPLITMGESGLGKSSSSTNSNLMGYGVINGRGYDPIILNGSLGTASWWDNANTARTSGPNGASSGSQNNPILVSLYKTNTASIYKITLQNSPMFHVKDSYSTNWTVWGVKIQAPWTSRNTDGIDPSNTTNITITNSVIGDGDDAIAVGAANAASSATTISNILVPNSHGISIGSYTTDGVSNMLVNGAYFQGVAADGNQEALHIKSQAGRGNTVQNITYENVCVQNVYYPMQVDAFYNSTTTGSTSIPFYKNITFANVHVLSSSVTPHIEFTGFSSSYVSTINLDNVVVDSAPTYTPAWQNSTITFTNSISGTGSPQVYPASLSTNSANTNGVTFANTPVISNANAFNCTGKFPLLVGELYATNSGTTYPNTLSVTNPATITLNAMVQPTNPQTSYTSVYSGRTNTYTGAPLPTGTVQFYEGNTLVGSGSLGANGTLAAANIVNPTVGTHTYTATIQSDSNYAALGFGSLTVTVAAGPASQAAFTTPPPARLTYGTAPGTVAVALEDVSGSATSSTANVTLTVSNATTGYSQSYTAAASSGTASFTLSASLPAVGTYTYTASSTGLTSASVNESVTPATLTVTANPASRVFDAVDPSYTYTVTGFVNNDSASVLSGAPVITSSAVRTSPAGSYPTTVTQETLSAANYVFALVGGTLTVNGGAPQTITFAPLPNLVSGFSYQLSARTTSGLPVTYTASGSATVSGTTLTVNGPGAVTVTASSAANADYAAAGNVSQSFTAQ